MKHQILTVCTACALLLTGCSGVSGKTEEQTSETLVVYKALPLPNLFVDIPERFEETSSEFYEKYYICDDASIIITEDQQSAGVSIKDYSIQALVQYQDLTKTLDITGDELVYADSLAVQVLEFTYTLAEDGPAISTMVGFAGDLKSVYIVTCKCAEEHYAEYRDDFMTVMTSMRIDKTENSYNTLPPTTAASE